MPHHLRSAQTGTSSETILNHYDHIGAPQLLDWHQEHGEGSPVITDGVVAVKDILERIDALTEKDARIKALVDEALKALPHLRFRSDTNPLDRTREILGRLSEALDDSE